MKEIFKEVKGYDGHYFVSNLGNVMSRKRQIKIILTPVPSTKGYLNVSLLKDGIAKTKKIHRLVSEAFIDNPLNLTQVNHKDGNKTNNRVDNLEWCDNSTNQKHAYSIGLQPSRKGVKNGNSKINKDIADKMRNIYATGKYRQYEIARQFGVTASCVTQVITKKIWV